jgi:eukaryotic-like serine/threonine-protein kinase
MHTGTLDSSPANLSAVSGQVPLCLGPYEVIAKIAGGGMATVFLGRAQDGHGAERIAAVKVIKAELSKQEQFVTMFLDEAKILSRLKHPNIARTLEYGVSDHQPFIAMELLLGRTLLDVWDACVAKSVPIRLDMAAWICARVADGLHYAHELCDSDGTWLHVIHRDVNPSNIFLTYDGEVKLFDFGLARARGRRHRTDSGIVKGKVAYLSPEQLEQLPIDRRTDIFTLGTTLWEATTMQRLFKKEQDIDTALAIKEAKITDPRPLVLDYPDILWHIVRRALAKDRNDRYQRALDLSRDLDSFARHPAEWSMRGLISSLLDDLFPGDRARQMGWLKTTQDLPPNSMKATMAPPARLPSVELSPKREREAARVPAKQAPPPLPPPRGSSSPPSRRSSHSSLRKK